MAEPPTKRARRTDSSTMWDINDKRARSSEPDTDHDRPSRREPPSREDGQRNGTRDNRRYRSRSREKIEKRRERSKSRDTHDRDRDGRRDRDRDGRGVRDRERSTSRDRHHGRRGYPLKSDRYYDRSRSPARNGTKARSRTPPRGSRIDRRDDRKESRLRGDTRHENGVYESKKPPRATDAEDEMDVDILDSEDPEDIETLMRKTMGFTKFRSTQNTKVPGNDVYGVRKEKKTEYRQYMNRSGGFNRPLSPTR